MRAPGILLIVFAATLVTFALPATASPDPEPEIPNSVSAWLAGPGPAEVSEVRSDEQWGMSASDLEHVTLGIPVALYAFDDSSELVEANQWVTPFSIAGNPAGTATLWENAQGVLELAVVDNARDDASMLESLVNLPNAKLIEDPTSGARVTFTPQDDSILTIQDNTWQKEASFQDLQEFAETENQLARVEGPTDEVGSARLHGTPSSSASTALLSPVLLIVGASLLITGVILLIPKKRIAQGRP